MGYRPPALPFAAFAILLAACAQPGAPGSTSGEHVPVAGWYVTTNSNLQDSRYLADGDPVHADIPVIVTYVPSGGIAGMDAVDMRVNDQTIHYDQDGPPYTMEANAAPWDPAAGEYTLTAYEMAGDQTMHENTITITRVGAPAPTHGRRIYETGTTLPH